MKQGKKRRFLCWVKYSQSGTCRTKTPISDLDSRNYKTTISDAECEAFILSDRSWFVLSRLTHPQIMYPPWYQPPFFTASPTAALKYTARKHFASCFFTESRRCWSPSTRTRCHRPSLSLESHFLIYPRLHVCPWLRAEKLWKGNPSETSGVFLLQHLTAASCSYHCCVCKRFNGWLSAQIIILYVWKEQKEAKLVSVGVFFL